MTVCDGLLAICLLPHTSKDTTFLTKEGKWATLLGMKLDVHCATDHADVGRALPMAVGADGIPKSKYDNLLTGPVLPPDAAICK